MQMRFMHSQMSSIYGYFGDDVYICISSTKGNLVQILAYVQFYKSENLCVMENLPFVHTQTFRMKSMQSCTHKAPDVSQKSGLAGFLVLLCCYNS